MSLSEKTEIFLSCGERKDYTTAPLDEFTIIGQIRDSLISLGYEVYAALDQHNLEGLVDDIFHHLDDSEYFLFVDFAREKLIANDIAQSSRGSLFTNQELALAKFLGKPVIAYQEKGVKKEDGILKFIHANPMEFDTRVDLVDRVISSVKNEWKTGWKNRIRLRRDPHEFSVADYGPTRRTGKWYHIEVVNPHLTKMAEGCFVTVQRVTHRNTGKDIAVEHLAEMKWENLNDSRISIPQGKSRKFDAVVFFDDAPKMAVLGVNFAAVDNTSQIVRLHVPGSYELGFSVFSNNFAVATGEFLLELPDDDNFALLYPKNERRPIPQKKSETILAAEPNQRSGSTPTTTGVSIQSNYSNPGTYVPVRPQEKGTEP